MWIVCLQKDRGPFEDLGFGIEEDGLIDPNGAEISLPDREIQPNEVVKLYANECNYANAGEMPTDVPWYGASGVGENYGPSVYACNGQDEIDQMDADEDCHSPVCRLITISGNVVPHPDDLEAGAAYYAMLNSTRKTLGMNPVADWKPEEQSAD